VDKTNVEAYFESISQELNAIKDRVEKLIDRAHWGEIGRFKECILVNTISRFLPDDISIGTGFVVVKSGNTFVPSKQIDLILYDNTYPVLFKEGNFVILTPEPVMGIIEVKSKTKYQGKNGLLSVLKTSYENARFIQESKKGNPRRHYEFFNGIFSYESDVGYQSALNSYKRFLQELYSENGIKTWGSERRHKAIKYLVNYISLNEDIFMRIAYHRFEAYEIKRLAPAYLISNIFVGFFKVKGDEQYNWFPYNDKSPFYKGKVPLEPEEIL